MASVSGIVPATAKVGASVTPAAGAISATAGLEFLETLRGASGKLKAAFRTPGEPLIHCPPPGLTARYKPDQGAAVVSRSSRLRRIRECTRSWWRPSKRTRTSKSCG